MSKGELSAFFRKPDHRNFKPAGDQVVRNLLQGMVKKYRPDSTGAGRSAQTNLKKPTTSTPGANKPKEIKPKEITPKNGKPNDSKPHTNKQGVVASPPKKVESAASRSVNDESQKGKKQTNTSVWGELPAKKR